VSVDLGTSWLGLRLAHPFIPGAGPLADTLDGAKRLEDAGAPAIVLRSLFEEQLVLEQSGAHAIATEHADTFGEALSFFPSSAAFALPPDAYAEHVRRLRASLAIPIIASLNGVTPGGWTEHAKHLEEAGASALELNLYEIATDPALSASELEAREVDVVRRVAGAVRIPVAVKLSPFYSALPAFVRALEAAGARGVVVYNRFYQPEIDPERLELERVIHLSDRSELNLRLHALAILSPTTGLDLAVSGGVHEPIDGVKAVMAGAHAVQCVSALLRGGPARLEGLVRGFRAWLEAHEYGSVDELRGSMNLARCPDPAAYERGNYVHLLHTWPRSR
jgi:dihydroorotate dehydrogenase (fumarate)